MSAHKRLDDPRTMRTMMILFIRHLLPCPIIDRWRWGFESRAGGVRSSTSRCAFPDRLALNLSAHTMGHPKAKEVFMKRLRITLLSFIAALLVASCATGPLFVEEPTIPDGQALVYIYRPYTLYGSAIKQLIMSNGGPVVRIAADGYYPY